jgi:hypothetical protein
MTPAASRCGTAASAKPPCTPRSPTPGPRPTTCGSPRACSPGIGDDIGHARTVLRLARALTLNGQADQAASELAAIEQAVRDYDSVGYLADLCTVLGDVHAALGDTTRAFLPLPPVGPLDGRKRP